MATLHASTVAPVALRPAASKPAAAYGSTSEAWQGHLRGAASDHRGAPIDAQRAHAPTAHYLASTAQLRTDDALPRSAGDSALTAASPAGWYDRTLTSPSGMTALPGAKSAFESSAFAVTLPSGGSPGGLKSARMGGGLRPTSAAAGLTRAAGAAPTVLRVTQVRVYSSTYAF